MRLQRRRRRRNTMLLINMAAEIQTVVQTIPDIVKMLFSIAPIIGCGYVMVRGNLLYLNDHNVRKTVGEAGESYNPNKHGKIFGFIEEGERVPDLPNNPKGEAPIHRHRESMAYGPYEF